MKENMIGAYKNYSPEEYNEMAMELIWRQQQYVPVIIEKYVTKGSVLSCKKGSIKNKFDILQDKGVYDNGNPACTLDDCIVGENVHTFCNCLLYHDSYGHRCIPEPVGNWMQPNSNVKAYNQQSQEYVEILKNSAVLPCGRGSYMTIDETPVPLAAEPSTETACYDTHRAEFQYNEDCRKAIYNYTQAQLEHFVQCMDDNLIIYDTEKKKYVIDIEKFKENRKRGDPKVGSSDDLVKIYTMFKGELIMRKYDLLMERHYKNWLIYDKTEDVTTDLTNLFKENTKLLIETRTKFMSADEVSKKKTGILTLKFFYDLVQDKNVWDIKQRVTSMDFLVDGYELDAIKKKLTDPVFDEAQNGTLVQDTITNKYRFTFRVEAYGKKYYIFNKQQRDRDYYGNYNYGYVGAAYFTYRTTDTLNFLLDASDTAQRGQNFPKVWKGDPAEDVAAITDGYNDYMGIVEL